MTPGRQDATGLRSWFGLDGKVALVTGAAQGLGWAMADALAQAGAHVAVNDRNAVEAEDRCRDFRERGLKATAFSFDVTDPSAALCAIESIRRQLGSVQIVVNNAGFNIRKPFEDYTSEEARALMDVHYFDAVNVTQAAIPGMKESGYGRIIMIGSITTQSTRVPMSCYAAAKGAVTALTIALAGELGPFGITTNIIEPGYFTTPMSRIFTEDPEYNAYIRSRVPVQRWGVPDDLAAAVLFLAGPGGGYISGQRIAINGGILTKV